MCVFVTWDMSLGCLLHLRCHQWWEDCDLVSLHTLLPGTIIRRAQRGQGAHTELSLCHPGAERVYKRRNTDGSSVSVVSHQQLSSGMFAVFIQVEWQDRGFEDWYEGWQHHTSRSLDPSLWICKEGGTTEYMRRHQSMKLLTEMNFEGWFIKTKHS